MADLPTPSIEGEFNTLNTSVSGTVIWDSQSNLNDLDQVRVRYVRRSSSLAKVTPSRNDVISLSSNTGGWASFSSGGNSFEYRDDVITSGFDITPPSYTDRSVNFSEGSLSGFYCWGIPRLEI